MVSINEFLAFDIRIGKIIEVEDHAAARKPMYRLLVDFGREIGKRTIVAGIRNVYSKEDLLNKKIVCVINLDPKMIAGAESQGMLLAAGELPDVSILVPDKEIGEGSRVR